jgi:hypothetical protein
MDMIDLVRSNTFLRDRRQQHGDEWMRRNVGDPNRFPSKTGNICLQAEKDEEAKMSVRKSDMLIVVMKQGNACGAKEHALLCRGLRKHCSSLRTWIRNGNKINPPIKECGRVLLVSSSEEPDEGNPQVRFCEGGKAAMYGMRLMRHVRGNPETSYGEA